MDEAKAEVLKYIKSFDPDLFIAGPAFNAGRYGVACGAIAQYVKEELDIPVITAMYIENPGVDMYKKDVYIIETGNSAASMRTALPDISKLAMKLAKDETLGTPQEENYIPRGMRKNVFVDEIGAVRAVDMLVKKMNDEAFDTEYPMPKFDNVAPGKAIKDLSKARIAVVTSGGIVPKGNPDKIEASSASKYGKYSIEGRKNLTKEEYETAHGGYDPTCADQDADVVVPVDVLRELESEGVIGKLHDYFYTTVGNGTSVANSLSYAEEIAKELVADGVDAVILTST
jgi:glycine reductase